MSTVTVVDPTTEQEVASYPEHGPEQIEAAVAAADAAFREWRRRPVEERGALLTAVAAGLRERAEELAQLVVSEMGKPLAEARFEIEKSALGLRVLRRDRPGHPRRPDRRSGRRAATVTYEPIGIIFAVMPWNFPVWQVIRFAGPALMAGNTALLKHAPNVSGTRAGAPGGVHRGQCAGGRVHEPHRGAGERPRRLGQADRRPARRCRHAHRLRARGRVRRRRSGQALKKSVLELGGSDPFVVLADADLDVAVKHAVTGRLMTRARRASRRSASWSTTTVVDDFQQQLVEGAGGGQDRRPARGGRRPWPARARGHPREPGAPGAATVAEGAELKTGGTRLDRPGYFFPPTVLGGVKPGMTAFTEETFGPVVAITPFATEDEAVELANDTRYGLGATVWSQDSERGEAVARRIESGLVVGERARRVRSAAPVRRHQALRPRPRARLRRHARVHEHPHVRS